VIQLRLYDYPASANCYKVRLLLAQLDVPYERVPVDIFGGDTLTDEYARINPLRSTPVLEVSPGRYLTESNAILCYLASGTPLLPGDPIALAEVMRWLIYEQTDIMPATGGLRFRLQTGRLAPDDPAAERRRAAGVEVLSFVDDHLATREFLVGDDYSVADVAAYGYLHVAGEAGFEMSRWPALEAWLRRIAGQPGHVNDLAPYPPNARPGAGRSTYDR
jgi:glutathione S-transferase